MEMMIDRGHYLNCVFFRKKPHEAKHDISTLKHFGGGWGLGSILLFEMYYSFSCHPFQYNVGLTFIAVSHYCLVISDICKTIKFTNE